MSCPNTSDDIQSTSSLGAGQEIVLDKLIGEQFKPPTNFAAEWILYLQSILYEIQKMDQNKLLSEILAKVRDGGDLSEIYFREQVLLDGSSLSIQNAVDNLTLPYIPDSLSPDFPLESIISTINTVTRDLQSTTFIDVGTVTGKYEKSGVWMLPNSCDLTSAYNYTVGSDIQHAARYLVAVDQLVSNEKWNMLHNFMCGETANNLAFAAKLVSIPVGLVTLFMGDLGAVLGGSEAIYTAYGGGCTMLGYHSMSMEYDKVNKLAHSLLEYNSSWPDAMMYVLELRNKVMADVEFLANSTPANVCSKDISISNINVPNKVCAEFLTQTVDANLTAMIQNNDPIKDAKIKLFTELYLMDNDNRLTHLRTDSTNTITLSPGTSQQITADLRVSANGLLWERQYYKVILKFVSSAGVATHSRTFQCLYGYQCDIQGWTDDTKDLVSGVIIKGEQKISQFTATLGAKLSVFTLLWPGSDLNLHIYDQAGNHVGYDSLSGLIEIEIPGAKYSGPDSYPEIISFPGPVGNYQVIVEGIDVVDSEYYSIEVFEEFEHIATLMPLAPYISIVGYPGDSIGFELDIQESGGHLNANSITVTSSELISIENDSISISSITVPFTEIPADSINKITGYILTDSSDVTTSYESEIVFSFNNGTLSVPIHLTLNPNGCCFGIRGNVDGDVLDQIDIADLVFLVAYMFQGGGEPLCMDEANIDGLSTIDIADLVALVAYMFQGGVAPAVCP